MRVGIGEARPGRKNFVRLNGFAKKIRLFICGDNMPVSREEKEISSTAAACLDVLQQGARNHVDARDGQSGILRVRISLW